MKKSILTVVIAAASISNAVASSISYNFTNLFDITEINQTGTLSFFDSTLGTLTGVELTLTGAAIQSFTGLNNAAQTQTARLTSTTELFVGSTLSPLEALLAGSNPLVTLSSNTGFQSFSPNALLSFGPFSSQHQRCFRCPTEPLSVQLCSEWRGQLRHVRSIFERLALTGGGGNIRTTQSTKAKFEGEIQSPMSQPGLCPNREAPLPCSVSLLAVSWQPPRNWLKGPGRKRVKLVG